MAVTLRCRTELPEFDSAIGGVAALDQETLAKISFISSAVKARVVLV
jgi:hypothetical protein